MTPGTPARRILTPSSPRRLRAWALLVSAWLWLGCADPSPDAEADSAPQPTEADTSADTGAEADTSADTGADTSAEADTSPPPALDAVAFSPQPGAMRRLTAQQYANALRDVFGPDLIPPARLEPDVRVGGFLTLGAAQTTVSGRGVELYEAAAFDVAGQALAAPALRARLLPCAPSSVGDAACMEAALRPLGRRLWRRPLSEAEVASVTGLALDAAAVLGSFDEGLAFGVAALLQSPKFLYRVEVADGATGALDGWSLASRLSFLLWDTLPDDALLEATERGELDTADGLRAQAERMLADPRARQGVRAFFSDLYELDRLNGLVKAPELFPHMGEDVGPSAREETLRLMEDVVFDQRTDWREVLTTRKAFLNRKLAAIYNVPAPAREGFAAVELPEEVPRRGLLGQVSVLALNAHPVSTSATLRGVFVRHKLLCQQVPPPPAGVDTSIPEPSGDAPTLRDRLRSHLESPFCASCHTFTDPVGLALENFDGIGRFRARDDGHPIDGSGEIDGRAFGGPMEMYEALREHERLGLCLSEKLYQYATAHEVAEGGEAMVEAISAHFAADGHDVQSLLLTLITSPAFRQVSTHEAHP